MVSVGPVLQLLDALLHVVLVFEEGLDVLRLDREAHLFTGIALLDDLLLEHDLGLLDQLAVPSQTKGGGVLLAIDLVCVEREVGVVEVDGGDGGIALGAFGDLCGLRVVDEDGQATEDDGLDLEEVVHVDPDCLVSIDTCNDTKDNLHLYEVKPSPPPLITTENPQTA